MTGVGVLEALGSVPVPVGLSELARILDTDNGHAHRLLVGSCTGQRFELLGWLGLCEAARQTPSSSSPASRSRTPGGQDGLPAVS